MDANVSSTQKIVIIVAVLLGLLVLLLVGYSLWNKAKTAEGELARKQALESLSKKTESEASISITGEANNPSNVTFESLTNSSENNQNVDNGQTFGALSTTTEEEAVPVATTTKTVTKKPVTTVKKTTYTNYDRPLTEEEIRRIRQLPIDNSATGNLQNKLEVDSNGQYQAQYK